MKTGWFILLAGSFYLFVVVLFWPVEKKILPASTGSPSSVGYDHGTVAFSDISVEVLIPKTIALQELGLGGRSKLNSTEGMLWLYDTPVQPSFWMKDMLIPLDFLWLKSGQVVEITPNVAPPATLNEPLPIYQPKVFVDGVLEVQAGFAARYGIQVGETLRLDRR